MLAEELVALCSARGVDLKRVAGASSELQGAAAPRRLRRDELRDGIERVPLSVRGSESRVYRRPQFSHAELGIAARGVHELPWLAARFSFAGSYPDRWRLWRALKMHAHRMEQRDGWAPMVPGRLPRAEPLGPPLPGATAEPHFYVERLAMLVLDEDFHRWAFRAVPPLFAWYMDVEDRTWRRVLEPRFGALQGIYQRWLGMARGMIQRRINGAEALVLRSG